MDDRLFIAYVDDVVLSTKRLMDAAGVAARIPTGASVALKPNLVVAKSPDSGATTHAEILAGVIEYLIDNGIKDVSIIEGSWVGDDTLRAFKAAGYDAVSKKYSVPLYDLKRDQTQSVHTAIGDMRICRRALDSGFLINLPVLKGHCQTTMTCALKNLKGCLPDSEKRRFHALGLIKPIAALAAYLKPPLTIVDGICGDLSFEEGGNPVYTNRLILGEDMVKIDSLGCRLMGISKDDVGYISLAEKYGAGSSLPGEIVTLGDAANALAYPASRGEAKRLGQNVRQDKACSACYGNLIHALYRLDEMGLLKKVPPIAIGQGMKGVAFNGVGIGRCCDGADVKVKGCPPNADDILNVLCENALNKKK